MLTVLDKVLDQAAAGREVHRVVLVDRRRQDEQRHLADLRGLRPVLDQLEDFGSQHHRTGRDREIAATLNDDVSTISGIGTAFAARAAGEL
jgi:hypothetical protein